LKEKKMMNNKKFFPIIITTNNLLLNKIFLLLPLLVSILWFILFVAINITTLELKPRGIYFSENALSPNRAHPTATVQDLQIVANYLHHKPNNITEHLSTFIHHTILIQHHYSISNCDVGTTKCWILFPKEANDRREAIVVGTTLPTTSSSLDAIIIITALFHGLATRNAQWLSKNIIFLFSPDVLSLQNWLYTYEHDRGEKKMNIIIIPRTGPIRGAVFLDLTHSDSSSEIGVVIQGGNGQQCNMDLFNVAINSLERHRLGETIHLVSMNNKLLSTSNNKLDNMIWDISKFIYQPIIFGQFHETISRRARMMWKYGLQLAFGPSGWHGIFLARGIDALTFEFRIQGIQEHIIALTGIESVVRSLSNIDERLHQSFFLYLMMSPYDFVSVEEYMWPFVLFCFPLGILALRGVHHQTSSSSSLLLKPWIHGQNIFMELMYGLAALVCAFVFVMVPLIMNTGSKTMDEFFNVLLDLPCIY
jgi:glycosylphosphatidylinositol transamidase